MKRLINAYFDFCDKYNVLPFLFLYVVCIYLERIYIPRWINTLPESTPVLFLNLFHYASYGLYLVPAKLFFDYYRRRKYQLLTGRNLREDMKTYNRNYADLMEFFLSSDPGKMDTNKLPRCSWKVAEGMILGRAPDGGLFHAPTGKDGKNYFIFGLPGSGKTAGPIICSCLRWGKYRPLSSEDKTASGSVFCIDLKNDIWEATHHYRNIKRFSLMEPEKSCHFDPLAGIHDMTPDQRRNYIANIGFNLIEQQGATGAGKYFYETAQDYWNGITAYLLEKNPGISFPEILHKILTGNAIDWVKKVCEDGCEDSKIRLASKFGENETNLTGGYSLLAQSCRKFYNDTLKTLLNNDPEAEYISPQMLEDGYDVYLQLEQAELANYAPLLSMIVQSFLSAFTRRAENPKAGRLPNGTLRPICLMLDEFAQLNTLKADSIISAFTTLRSRNVSIVCALQSISSISEMFHSENTCRTLTDCITTFSFLSVQDVTTREWASKLFGSKKVLRRSNSLSSADSRNAKTTGISVSEAQEPIISPEEFGNLKDPETGKDEIMIYSQGKYLRANKVYYFKD